MENTGPTGGRLEVGAIAILGLGVLFLVIHDLTILLFPYDLIYGEGFVLRDIALLRAGQNPYAPLAPPPSVVANYPPVYPAVAALFSLALGPGFLGPRLVSILATGAAAFFLFRIARRALGPGRAAWFAPLLFLADLVVYYWSPYARVDTLALALDLAALELFHRGSRGPDDPSPPGGRIPRAWWGGVGLALLAFFARPTSIGAIVAMLAALGLGRDRGGVARLGIAFAAGVVAIAAALNAATGGEFLLHTVAYNANVFRWAELGGLMLGFLTPHSPLLLAAVAYLLIAPRSAERRLLGSYFAFGCASALLIGKVGSSENYFLPPVAAAALLASIAIGRAEGPLRRLLLVAAAAGPLLFTTVPGVKSLELRRNPFPAMGRTPDADDRRAGEELDALVRETAGPVLIEDAGYLVRAGKRVWAAPLVLDYLEGQGLYDPAPLVRMIERREFEAVVISYNFYSPAMRRALGDAYQPRRAIEIPGRYNYIVLTPRPEGER